MKDTTHYNKGIFIILMCLYFFAHGQENLIQNFSLEDTLFTNNIYKFKYNSLGDQFKNCKYWFATDNVIYINQGQYNYIKSKKNKIESFHKKSHAAIVSKYFNKQWFLNGFLMASIKDSLIKGRQYAVQFYFRPKQITAYTIKQLQASFQSKNIINPYSKPRKLNLAYTSAKNGWIKATGNYTANGHEKFLLFGHFDIHKIQYLKTKKYRKKPKKAITLIDSVSLIQLAQVKKHFKSKKNKHLLKINVLFKDNSFNIQPSEKEKILSLSKKIKYAKKIFIHGYTSAKGTLAHNKKLSLKRAKCIANYITKINSKSSITIIGKGIDKNSKNQHESRRVEIILKF